MLPYSLILLSACATVHPAPQGPGGLTRDQFRQTARRLDTFPSPGDQVVIVSPSYRQVRDKHVIGEKLIHLFQVRRYPFANENIKLNYLVDNDIETTNIEEKIRKVNEALDKEIQKEEAKILEELSKEESFAENVLDKIKEIETELAIEALEEDFEIEDFDISSLVDTRKVPLEKFNNIVPISQLDFGIIQELE